MRSTEVISNESKGRTFLTSVDSNQTERRVFSLDYNTTASKSIGSLSRFLSLSLINFRNRYVCRFLGKPEIQAPPIFELHPVSIAALPWSSKST